MIETGEYIRTKKGEIMKVTSIPVKVDGKVTYQTDKGWVELECDIVKHSKNIVDLIEIGDFVFTEETLSYSWNEMNLKNMKKFFSNGHKIKKILTYEQYEQNCYRLEKKIWKK